MTTAGEFLKPRMRTRADWHLANSIVVTFDNAWEHELSTSELADLKIKFPHGATGRNRRI